MMRKRIVIFVVIAALVVGGVTLGCLVLGRAKVEGQTAPARIASICRLADTNTPGAVEAIVSAAGSEPDPAVRAAALTALAKFPAPRRRAAVERAATDPDPGVRAAAAATLGVGGDESVVAQLERLARTDPETQVRLGAVAGLGQNPTDSALAALVDLADTADRHAVGIEAFRRVLVRFKAPDWMARDEKLFVSNLERFKATPEVRSAFQTSGRSLYLHPERILSEGDEGSRQPQPTSGKAPATPKP